MYMIHRLYNELHDTCWMKDSPVQVQSVLHIAAHAALCFQEDFLAGAAVCKLGGYS
jgi:hypothetical protein